MPRHIERQREVETQEPAQFPDALVQPPLDIPVPLIAVVAPQHRQQVRRIFVPVFAQQRPERRLDLYLEQLVRLAPPVHQHVPPDVFFFEITHVDERHAAGEQAEPEQVACQLPVLMLPFQVQPGNPVDFLFRDGALGRPAAFQLDPVERMGGAVDEPVVVGLVVNGAELFYIEHNRIGGIALLPLEIDEASTVFFVMSFRGMAQLPV